MNDLFLPRLLLFNIFSLANGNMATLQDEQDVIRFNESFDDDYGEGKEIC